MDLGGFEAIRGWGRGGLDQLTPSTLHTHTHAHTHARTNTQTHTHTHTHTPKPKIDILYMTTDNGQKYRNERTVWLFALKYQMCTYSTHTGATHAVTHIHGHTHTHTHTEMNTCNHTSHTHRHTLARLEGNVWITLRLWDAGQRG